MSMLLYSAYLRLLLCLSAASMVPSMTDTAITLPSLLAGREACIEGRHGKAFPAWREGRFRRHAGTVAATQFIADSSRDPHSPQAQLPRSFRITALRKESNVIS